MRGKRRGGIRFKKTRPLALKQYNASLVKNTAGQVDRPKKPTTQRLNPFGVLAGRPLARGARRQRRTVRSRSFFAQTGTLR